LVKKKTPDEAEDQTKDDDDRDDLSEDTEPSNDNESNK
jgi:hypothetical protein